MNESACCCTWNLSWFTTMLHAQSFVHRFSGRRLAAIAADWNDHAAGSACGVAQVPQPCGHDVTIVVSLLFLNCVVGIVSEQHHDCCSSQGKNFLQSGDTYLWPYKASSSSIYKVVRLLLKAVSCRSRSHPPLERRRGCTKIQLSNDLPPLSLNDHSF